MIPITQFPMLVEQYASFYQPIFSEEGLVQFKRYITGLLVGENKTIAGINQLFVTEERSQSSLNRWLKQSRFPLDALNKARLAMLESMPETQMKEKKGVLSIDDTLLTHYGQQFEKIAKLWDHVDNRYVWAHNLVSLHYSDEQTDYPVEFKLWEPADLEKLETGLPAIGVNLRSDKFALKTDNPVKWRQYLLGVWSRNQTKEGVTDLYQSKLHIAQKLLAQWVKTHPDMKLPVTFDSWYTKPAFCHYIDKTLELPYVGTLDKNQDVIVRHGKQSVGQFAAQLKAEHLAAVKNGNANAVFKSIKFRYKGKQEAYYSYCQIHHIASFGKQRLVINYRRDDLSDTPTFYISNRRRWQAKGITRIRRHRWPVEVYYEEGKAEGLEQYQLRNFEGIERHVALVAVVYSLLRTAQQDTVLQDRLQSELKIVLEGTAPFWRRATSADALWQFATVISSGVLAGESLSTIVAPYIKAICA